MPPGDVQSAPDGGTVARMRLERPHRTERFGAVRVHELQRVIELDSASGPGDETATRTRASLQVSTEAIRAIERDMAIVVGCMNETRKVIEGVLSGIPHDCLIILVSNSSRHPVDRYAMEVQTVDEFCAVGRAPRDRGHQRDPAWPAALKEPVRWTLSTSRGWSAPARARRC